MQQPIQLADFSPGTIIQMGSDKLTIAQWFRRLVYDSSAKWPHQSREIVIRGMLEAAGFIEKHSEALRITFGPAVISSRDDCSCRAPENINKVCGWKIEYNGQQFNPAIRWLEDMYEQLAPQWGDESQIIDWVDQEILRSRPLDAIRLTTKGEYLFERAPLIAQTALVNHTRPGWELMRGPDQHIGIHAWCGGPLHIHQVGERIDALWCDTDNLRVVIDRPDGNEMRTYADLAQWSHFKFRRTGQ